MTRHWQIPILKDGNQIRLIVTTTTSMIDVDLGGDPDRSLIRMARQYHRHAQNEEQNHRDLAIGAIMTFAGLAPYDLSDTHVETTEAAPQTEAQHYVGGPRGDSLVPVWEETDERETWE
jgi:hypothetical protein